MTVTINAHQLGRLIDKTINHTGSEYTEPLNGIRLDVDAKNLYAVATDRYTLAVARYQLNHREQDQQPWARTIPAGHLRALREWIDSQAGADYVSIAAEDHYLHFGGTQTELRIGVSPGMEFPDWRGLLRGMVEQTVEGELFPAFNSGYLSRFNTGDILCARFTADQKPAVVFAEDFIGALMPARHAGIYPCKEESFEVAHKAWLWTLAAGDTTNDLNSAAYEENRPRYDATTDIRETGAGLLQEVLRSTTDCQRTDIDAQRDLWDAHIRIGVASWMAFRYLDALHNVDPRAAQSVVNEVAGQLDSGEISEWAWDEAKAAGFDPQKWHDDYEAHLAALKAERTDEHAESAAITAETSV